MNLAKSGMAEKFPTSWSPGVHYPLRTYRCKALLERSRIRALKGNDVNEGLGGVLIQGKEEDLSLRPRPEKETLKIGRSIQYLPG